MSPHDPYEQLIEELVWAIELRECGDPDAGDEGVSVRIRRLEQQLVEHHRQRAGRWAADDVASRLAGREEGLPPRTPDLVGAST